MPRKNLKVLRRLRNNHQGSYEYRHHLCAGHITRLKELVRLSEKMPTVHVESIKKIVDELVVDKAELLTLVKVIDEIDEAIEDA